MPKEFKEILEKLLEDEDLLKIFDKSVENQKKYDCEINIKKQGMGLECKMSGSSIGMLIALKTALDEVQKKLDISDKELNHLMSHVIKTGNKEGN